MKKRYRTVNDYYREIFGEKIFKLPIDAGFDCPNRDGTVAHGGCTFCTVSGSGDAIVAPEAPIREQFYHEIDFMHRKWPEVHKYLVYFQNFTNTFLPLEIFRSYIEEASRVPDIVEIAVSTRPDCIRDDYLDVLHTVREKTGIQITIELGLQTVNYHTLKQISRGHSLAEFIDAVLHINKYSFDICTHVILNLPGDDLDDSIETAKILSALPVQIVKAHSLYIAKNTKLCEAYENGTISLCKKEEYLNRLILFLEYLRPDIAIERLFSRIPEKDAVFCNWDTSWWKLRDELFEIMTERQSYQGKAFHYLNGSALRMLKQ